MKLSIIVPVYNVKDYLVKCLDSIWNQTLDEYEVIVVDDGSTDGSGQIVDEYCHGKNVFTVFHKENGGLMSAWMYGVKKASGDYLGFVDSDDYVSKDMFAILCDKAFENDADIVMCDRYDVRGELISEPHYDYMTLEEGLYVGNRMDTIKQMVFPLQGMPELTKARWNKIFKRSLFLENTRYCECLSKTFEDRYITPPCVFSANSFYYVKRPLYYYLHRGGSNSGMYKPDLLEQIKRMYEIQKKSLEDKELFSVYGVNWEYVFMDYIRQYITRNIKNVQGFGTRLQSSRQLLGDNLVHQRIKKYGHLDKSKMGRALYFSYTLKSPLLLALFCYL